jgi:hypothetical protein
MTKIWLVDNGPFDYSNLYLDYFFNIIKIINCNR